MRDALKFSKRQWMAYVIAPLLPLGGVAVLAIFGILCGAIDSFLPAVGDDLIGVLGGVLLLLGLAMSVLLNVALLGWPLMVVAISTEDSDGFDGLSRAYGLVLDRPVYALLLAAGAFGLGIGAQVVVTYLFMHGSNLTSWGINFGGGHVASNTLMRFWGECSNLLIAGYGVSYFWSSWTAIYMLLRQADDGTPLSTVVGADA